MRGVNLTANNGAIRFETPSSTPSTTSGERLLYVNSSNQLIFDDGSSATTLGSAGGVSNFSLNDAYDDGSTITVDSAAVTFNSSVATSAIQITASAGADITGTSSTWSFSRAGALTCVSIADSATNATLQVDGNGTGGVNIGSTSTGGITLGANTTLASGVTITQTGTAGSTVHTVTAGDVVLSDGSIAITDADNAASFAITNATATTADVATITANGLTTGSALLVTSSGTVTSAGEGVVNVVGSGVTTGSLLKLDATEATLNGGYYIQCYDDTATGNVFLVGEDGATTITGAGGSNVISVTAGDVVLSDGSITVTDADDATSLSITNDSAAAASLVEFIGSGTFTGTGSAAFLSIEPTGLTSGDAVNIQVDAGVTGSALRLASTGIVTGAGAALEIVYDAATTAGASAGQGIVQVSADGLTTGAALNVESLSNEVMTSGVLAHFDHSASGTTVAAKTGSVVAIDSSITESGTSTQDYDVLGITRTSIHDTAGTLTAQGSILRLALTSTETGATLTDTVVGLEVVMNATGTGDGLDVTHSATAGRGLDINVAATSVPGVDIDGTGVKANNVGELDVANSGATAAGGSILRVTNTGTPAAGTSYLVDFDYSGATMTNNPDCLYVAHGGTGRIAHFTSSGLSASASPGVDIESTNAGAVGAVLRLFHQGGSQANSDVVGRIIWTGEDDAAADEIYGTIDVVPSDVAAANPDSDMNFSVDVAGTLTQRLQVSGAVNGIEVGDGSAAAIVSSNGAQDLVLETNNGTNSSTITITDAANGDISFAMNGTANLNLQNVNFETGSETTTATITWGDSHGQVVFCTSAGGAYSITLPAVATVAAGGWYTFVKTDAVANAITLDGNASETIDGSTTFAGLDAQYDTVTIMTDGSAWYIISRDIT